MSRLISNGTDDVAPGASPSELGVTFGTHPASSPSATWRCNHSLSARSYLPVQSRGPAPSAQSLRREVTHSLRFRGAVVLTGEMATHTCTHTQAHTHKHAHPCLHAHTHPHVHTYAHTPHTDTHVHREGCEWPLPQVRLDREQPSHRLMGCVSSLAITLQRFEDPRVWSGIFEQPPLLVGVRVGARCGDWGHLEAAWAAGAL